jgi:hypothetical protein
MGGVAHVAIYPMSGAEVKRTSVRNTMSLALDIGRVIGAARRNSKDPFDALTEFLPSTPYKHGRVLFDGKIIDLRRETTEGFAVGLARVQSFENPDEIMDITFQNENLVAKVGDKLHAIVPDLICICDRETAEPITTEALRYGQRVKIYGVSAPDIMRTPEALNTFGPACFGLEDPFVPLERLQ